MTYKILTVVQTTALFLSAATGVPAIELDTSLLTGAFYVPSENITLRQPWSIFGWRPFPVISAMGTVTLQPAMPMPLDMLSAEAESAFNNDKASQFPGWNINPISSPPLKGTIVFKRYRALDEWPPRFPTSYGRAGADIDVDYIRHPDDPPNLAWMQYFEDDRGIFGRRMHIDPFPNNDMNEKLPFYWPDNEFSEPFHDFPGEEITSIPYQNSVRFETYLVEYDPSEFNDGTQGGHITVHQGFKWGYDIDVDRKQPEWPAGPIYIVEDTDLTELHWVVGRRFRDFSGTELTHTGPFDTWGNEFSGVFSSTEGSTYEEAGTIAGNSVSVAANIDFVGPRDCFLCPWSEVDVGHGAQFWVKGPPGTPFVVERDADVFRQNLSELEPENDYSASIRVENEIPTDGPIIDPLTKSGVFRGLSGPQTMVVDGELYSRAYSFQEDSEVWHNTSASTTATIRGQQARMSSNKVWIDQGVPSEPSFCQGNSCFGSEAANSFAMALGDRQVTGASDALLTIPTGTLHSFTSTSFDPDNGTEAGVGIWLDEWTLRSLDFPDHEPFIAYGPSFEFLFDLAGNYELTLRSIDDEGMDATLSVAFAVTVPEPSCGIIGMIAIVAFSFVRARRTPLFPTRSSTH
ncbi:MAG: hypothetical protein WD851_07850 [Pirellulales bacterium]